MAQLSPQQVGIAGTALTYGPVSATDVIAPDDRAFLLVRNASGSADTVTVVTPGVGPGGIPVPDITVTVPASNGERLIGPLGSSYADPSTGLVSVTHSVTTSVTCALVRI